MGPREGDAGNGGATARAASRDAGWMSRGRLRALVALATAVAFWAFYRYYIPQGDDLRFTAQRYHPFGAFTAKLWFHFLRTDYLHISGRTATAVGMLLMRPGVGFFRVVAPLICVWLMLAFAAWLRPDAAEDRGWPRVLATTVAAAAILPMTLVFDPRLNGDVLAWCMSFANYVLPTAAMVTVAVVLLRLVALGSSEGPRAARPRAVLAVPLALLTPSLHENMGTGMIALVAISVAVAYAGGGRRPDRLGWTIIVLGLLGSIEILTAPGLWERVGYSNGPVPSGDTGVLLRLHRIANGCAVTLQVGAVPLLVTAGVLVVTALRGAEPGRGHRGTSWLALLLVLDAVGMLGAWYAWQHVSASARAFSVSLDAGGNTVMFGLVVLSLVFVLLVIALAWRLRARIGVRPVMSVVTALGCGGTAIVSGVSTPRAYMHMALWLTLAAAATLLDAVGHLASRGVASVMLALLTGVCVVVSAVWWCTGLVAMRANRSAWSPVQRQFTAARASGHGRQVVVPMTLPHSDYQFDHGFDLRIYTKAMVQWYDLPGNTRLVQGP